MLIKLKHGFHVKVHKFKDNSTNERLIFQILKSRAGIAKEAREKGFVFRPQL